MSILAYHRIILDSVIRTNNLPPPRLGMSDPNSHHTFIATVEVYIPTRHGNYEYLTFSSEPDRVRARAEEKVCKQAVAQLDQMGFRRRHYKSDLNNIIVNRDRRALTFHRTESGPQDQRIHTSTVVIDGRLTRYTATCTRELYADDLAAKFYLEAHYGP